MTDAGACQDRHTGRPGPSAYIGVGFGVANVSAAAILIRLAQTSVHSLTIATWRLVLASLILTPLVAAGARRLRLHRLSGRDWAFMAASGMLLAVHFASWITSLAHTTVAASVTLVTTTPVFVGIASHVLLRERLPRGSVAALVVATIGTVAIGLGDLEGGTHQVLGDLLALVGAVSGAGYFLIGRRLRSRLSLLAYVYPVYCTAAITLVAWMLASGVPRLPDSPRSWLWILLMAAGPQLLGHSMLNWALRYVSATYVTIATLAEPVGSTLLAWLVLGEAPGALTIGGGIFVLAAVAIASRAEHSAVRRSARAR